MARARKIRRSNQGRLESEFWALVRRLDELIEEDEFSVLPHTCGSIEDGRFAIDLHGCTRSVAEIVVSEFLRWLRSNGIEGGRIIHGKGTGVMREVVREALARYPVRSFPHEGYVDFQFEDIHTPFRPVSTDSRGEKLGEIIRAKDPETYEKLYRLGQRKLHLKQKKAQAPSRVDAGRETGEVAASSAAASRAEERDTRQDIGQREIAEEPGKKVEERKEDRSIVGAIVGAIIGLFLLNIVGLIIGAYVGYRWGRRIKKFIEKL